MTAADLLAIDWSRIVRARGTAHSAHGPGPRLDGFPLLAIAPKAWGDAEVRTEDVGAPAAAIAGDLVAGMPIDEVASKYKTTAAHVRQALAHAIANIEEG